jgi:hypothetical protein
MSNKKKSKKLNIHNSQNGGDNVIDASIDIINSMIALGQSIFTEIDSITHIQSDINNVSKTTSAIPTVSSPPQFNPPSL